MDIGVVVAVCALSLVCLGVIVVVGLWLARVVRGSVLNPLSSIMGDANNDLDSDSDFARPSIRGRRPTESSIRQKRQNLDFDAAVQRKRNQQSSSASGMESSKPSLNRPNSAFDSEDSDYERNSRFERSRRKRDDYEIYDDGEDGFFEL